MGYTLNIEGFEGQNMEVNIGFWSGPKLVINGETALKGSKRGEMALQRNDGRQVTATWKPQFMGLDVPQLVVDGKAVNLVEPLKWYQWAWGGWPIFLIFAGGLLGGFSGAVALTLNAKIFRTEMNDMLKYLVSGAIAVASVIGYFVIALILSFIINS
jgi:hypothetical protein